MDALVNGSEVKEIPSLIFIQECRIVLQLISETLIGQRLEKAKSESRHLQMKPSGVR